MELTLNYFLNDRVVKCGVAQFEESWYHVWLDSLVKTGNDVIFFFTTETTDIWGPPERHVCLCHAAGNGACPTCKEFGCKVWDFNRVALPRSIHD